MIYPGIRKPPTPPNGLRSSEPTLGKEGSLIGLFIGERISVRGSSLRGFVEGAVVLIKQKSQCRSLNPFFFVTILFLPVIITLRL